MVSISKPIQKNYRVRNIPIDLLKDMTPAAATLYSFLENNLKGTSSKPYRTYHEGKEYIRIKYETLIKCIGYSLTTIKTAIKELKELGILMVEKLASNRSDRSNYFFITQSWKSYIPAFLRSKPAELFISHKPANGYINNSFINKTNKVKEKKSYSPVEKFLARYETKPPIDPKNEFREDKEDKPSDNIVIAEPKMAPTQESRGYPISNKVNTKKDSLGSVLGRIGNKIGIKTLNPHKNFAYEMMEMIDQYYLPAEVKEFYKKILKELGKEGPPFIKTYLPKASELYKLYRSPINQDWVMEFKKGREYEQRWFERTYGDTFKKLKIRIV